MENSPLNLAHQQHRKAETYLRYRKFEEAIVCHQRAAELLEEALKTTSVPRALESLTLQKNFHIKQKDIISEKKKQYENYKKIIEYNQERMAKTFMAYESIRKRDDEKNGLQIAIYKTMTEQDSLLDYLKRRGIGSDTDSMRSLESSEWDDKTVSADIAELSENIRVMGVKRPKDDQTVIEELQILNKQLQSLVCQLVMELDTSAQENESLRDRIKTLELEREKYVPKYDTSGNLETASVQNNLELTTDYVESNESPHKEINPDVFKAQLLPKSPQKTEQEVNLSKLMYTSSTENSDV